MPVYLVTDSLSGVRTMAEAERPATALNIVIGQRFDVSPAMDAADALRMMSEGVAFMGLKPLDDPDDMPFEQPCYDPSVPEFPEVNTAVDPGYDVDAARETLAMIDGPLVEAEEPAPDYEPVIEATYFEKPARASEGETWWDAEKAVLRYAHETPNGIKWYPQPPASTEAEAEVEA